MSKQLEIFETYVNVDLELDLVLAKIDTVVGAMLLPRHLVNLTEAANKTAAALQTFGDAWDAAAPE